MNEMQNMLEKLRDDGYKFLNLHFTGLMGSFHTLVVPVASVREDELSRGVPFDGSSVPGFGRVERGDMALKPDPTTLFHDSLDPEDDLAGVICSIVEADTGADVARDPRTVLKKAAALVKNELGAESFWLPEPEFYVFDSARYFFDDTSAIHAFELGELMHLDENSSPQGHLERKGGYHSAEPLDKGYEFRRRLSEILQNIGIEVRYHHHEVGACQHEIEIKPAPAVQAADAVVLTKYFARKLAAEFDVAVTFMPKPLYNYPGSGLHFHQWLAKNDVSLFWDENSSYEHLSELGKNYIGGLLANSDALTALTNPSTNSFKRLVPGFEAPTRKFYGLANRSAAVRIPKYVDTPELKRVEYRPPDATCNPYLAISGMLLAGLDGIRNKIDPVAAKFGPIDSDVMKLPEEQRAAIAELPPTLTKCAQVLLANHSFLTKDGVFDVETVNVLAKILSDTEIDLLRRPTPFEIAKYFGL